MIKASEDNDKNPTSIFANYLLILNKFALKVFNWLSHNWKINKLLVTSFLFDLQKHNSLKVIVKTINIKLLKIKFSLILNGQNFN